LLAFLYDRSNREHDGTFTAKRFGQLHSHLIWLVLTWCLWVLGASLFAASVAQIGECQLHCTQLRIIPAFAFIELCVDSVSYCVTHLLTRILEWQSPSSFLWSSSLTGRRTAGLVLQRGWGDLKRRDPAGERNELVFSSPRVNYRISLDKRVVTRTL
jgi:hypothetical protein